ncbi:MAG: hypothetical protein HRU15_03910 [Planctomycetes bacterium]|nr:hypothetical protein [Planctomycetota bacterium]
MIEMLTVIGIILLLAAIVSPIAMSVYDSAERTEVRDEVIRLTAVWDLIKVEDGTYPEPEVGETLTWDPSEVAPGLLNGVISKYNFSISSARLNDQNNFIDVWGDPIKYVKGDYKNRIDKLSKDRLTDNPQDENKPIGDPLVDIAYDSDWNPDNKGGFAYIWSYGGEESDEEQWIYQKRD